MIAQLPVLSPGGYSSANFASLSLQFRNDKFGTRLKNVIYLFFIAF
jgi:hypothetical protein